MPPNQIKPQTNSETDFQTYKRKEKTNQKYKKKNTKSMRSNHSIQTGNADICKREKR